MGPSSRNLLVLPCSLTSLKQMHDRQWNVFMETQVIVPARWQYIAGLEQGFPEVWICFKSVSNKWVCCWVFFIIRIHRYKNQEVEIGVTPLTVTPRDSPAKYLLWDFILCWSTDHSSRGRNASTKRHNCTKLETKTHLALWGSLCLWINRQRGELRCWLG